MSEENKPREFWIIKEPPYSTWVSDKPLCSADTDEEIHVIEYSAYKALKARHVKLLDALKEISKEFGTDYADGNTIIAREAIEADAKAYLLEKELKEKKNGN